MLIMVMFYAKYELLIGRGVLFLGAFFTFVSVWSFRHFYRMVAGYGLFQKNALVVGDGRDAASVIRLLEEVEDPGFRIYGLVAHNKIKAGEFISKVPVLGHIERLREFVAHYRVETLIVATSLSKEPTLLKILRPLRYAGVEILDYASFNEQIAQRIPLDHIDDEWLMHAAMNSSRIHIRNIKRIMGGGAGPVAFVADFAVCDDAHQARFRRTDLFHPAPIRVGRRALHGVQIQNNAGGR
jgi:FlaA1/EpsC-like NDP-sugar epimerase